MGKKHLKYKDRVMLETYLSEGMSIVAIASRLGVHRTTIHREIKNNTSGLTYNAETAQKLVTARRASLNQARAKINQPEVTKGIREELSLYRYSPAKISHRLLIFNHVQVCPETIYKIIDTWKQSGLNFYKYLRFKNKKSDKRGRNHGRGLIQGNKKNLKMRNQLHDIYHEPLNFEGDVMEGKKGEDEPVLAVFVECRSSAIFARKLQQKTAEQFNEAAKEVFAPFDEIGSLTFDNGTETAHWETLEEVLNTEIYFCSPAMPWHKGHVENSIRQLRQFFPKRKSLKRVTQEEIDKAVSIINSRPMEKLYGFTPANLIFGSPHRKDIPLDMSVQFSLV